MSANTHEVIAAKTREARLAGLVARRRRARMAELHALGLAGALVLTGLLAAALFCLLTHRISA